MKHKKIIVRSVFAIILYCLSYLAIRTINYAEINEEGEKPYFVIRGEKYLAKESFTVQQAQWIYNNRNAVRDKDHIEYNLGSDFEVFLSKLFKPLAQLDYFITGMTTWRVTRTPL